MINNKLFYINLTINIIFLLYTCITILNLNSITNEYHLSFLNLNFIVDRYNILFILLYGLIWTFCPRLIKLYRYLIRIIL